MFYQQPGFNNNNPRRNNNGGNRYATGFANVPQQQQQRQQQRQVVYGMPPQQQQYQGGAMMSYGAGNGFNQPTNQRHGQRQQSYSQQQRQPTQAFVPAVGGQFQLAGANSAGSFVPAGAVMAPSQPTFYSAVQPQQQQQQQYQNGFQVAPRQQHPQRQGFAPTTTTAQGFTPFVPANPGGGFVPAAGTSNNNAFFQQALQQQQQQPSRASSSSSAKPCKYFAMGQCVYGDQCKYSHAIPPTQGMEISRGLGNNNSNNRNNGGGSFGAQFQPARPQAFTTQFQSAAQPAFTSFQQPQSQAWGGSNPYSFSAPSGVNSTQGFPTAFPNTQQHAAAIRPPVKPKAVTLEERAEEAAATRDDPTVLKQIVEEAAATPESSTEADKAEARRAFSEPAFEFGKIPEDVTVLIGNEEPTTTASSFSTASS